MRLELRRQEERVSHETMECSEQSSQSLAVVLSIDAETGRLVRMLLQ